jgi:MFS family permease
MVIGLVGGSLGILIVALAPSIPVVLVGWCIAQLLFNALLAALVAVLPDQVPVGQRGLVAGVLGVCVPVASVSGTFLVKLFTGNQLAMFLVPCAVGAFFILLFAVRLDDRRLARTDKPAWSLREFASTFYVNPRKSPDFAWAFASRFMFVLAYAFLTTYQAYCLLDKLGSAESEVPRQIFLGTLTQSVVVVAASLIGGKLSDRTGRRKSFVLTVRDRHRQQLQRVPGRHGHRRARLRRVHGRRPRAGGRRAAGQRQRRQGSRRAQHRRRASLLRRAGHRAGRPGHRRRQLRVCCTRSPGSAPSSEPSPSCP